MKIKQVVILIALITVGNSYGLSQCPPNEQYCGKNPFATLVVGLSQVCSERQPRNAGDYERAVVAFFKGNATEYEQLTQKLEFQKGIQEFRKIAASMSQAELDKECATLLSKGMESTAPDEPRK